MLFLISSASGSPLAIGFAVMVSFGAADLLATSGSSVRDQIRV